MKITDSTIKRICSAVMCRRGAEYFRDGRIHLKKRSDRLITAVADGESLYNISVRFNEDGSVADTMCTCPYFETMHTPCKHIAACLMQIQAEQEERGTQPDENDRLASMLCEQFDAQEQIPFPLPLRFTLYINSVSPEEASISAEIGGTTVKSIEHFLDMYARKKSFLLSRSVLFDPKKQTLPPYEDEILTVLAESCANRSCGDSLYTKASYRTPFCAETLLRLLPLLRHVSFELIFNGLRLDDVRFMDEDPDILTDITAAPGEITLSVSDKGYALTRGGEYFLHDGLIYVTTEDFRKFFMPIYTSLSEGRRTQLSFKGENSMLFASRVLPAVKDKRGVICRGVDDIIVNERPSFSVYLDAPSNDISAAVIARYGDITFRLGTQSGGESKIIVRDSAAEADIFSYFSDFENSGGSLRLSNDDKIFDFLTSRLPELEKKASVFTSEAFSSLKISGGADIRTEISYDPHIDLLEADFSTELSADEIHAILAAVKLRERFYRRSDGSFISLEGEGKRSIELLERLEFSPSDVEKHTKRLPKYHALYLNARTDVKKDKSFTDYISGVRQVRPNIPDSLKGVLRDYQADGVRWLKQLSLLGFGGILADDMGLGKTLQVLAFIDGEKPKKPVLIVAPSALTYNWQSECERFTPGLKTLIPDGTRDERAKKLAEADGFDIIITSYPILRRDLAQYMRFEFSYCFIDEAQYIKNPKTMNARSVKKINAQRRFALTGTPIENSLSELWSIFDFIMSGYLYDLRTFKSVYETPVTREGDRTAADDLRAKIKPFILRRMKTEVLSELPEKFEYTMYAEMTQEQKKMYSSYLALAKSRTLALLGEGKKMQILTLLMRLRQICCHPALFDEGYTHESGKLMLLSELAESGVLSGHRLLIFSQYTSMLELIRGELAKKKLRCFYLDGKTPSYERLEMADRFNGGERDIFLVSLRAGGTGLNLTGADMVIHYDPWWNPAATDQASDRAYRIGQTRSVQVIRLAAKGTIEERILKLQESKRALAGDMIAANSETFASLTNEEILSLFEQD